MADLLQGVREGAVEGSGDVPQDFKMPSREELLAAIEKMTGLSEEDKQRLLESVVTGNGEPGAGSGFRGLPAEAIGAKSAPLEIVWVLTLVSLVFLVLAGKWPSISFVLFFMRMNRLKVLSSIEHLVEVVSGRSNGISGKVLEKIQGRIGEEKIKLFCAVFYSFLATLFVFTCVFFGYKLYKSLVDRERRREEKKRQKLQKKKK